MNHGVNLKSQLTVKHEKRPSKQSLLNTQSSNIIVNIQAKRAS